MTEASAASTPGWRVITVLDPDAPHSDFAHTVGLHEHGRPELVLSARPTEGVDPGGADWHLNQNDLAVVLDRLARQFSSGQLTGSGSIREPMDNGLSTATFRLGDNVDEPGGRITDVDPDATLISIEWSLERVPEGAATPLTALAEAGLRASLAVADVASEAGDVERLPTPWDGALAAPAFSVDGLFGPTTALVLRRGAQILIADSELLTMYFHQQAATERVYSCRTVLGAAHARARLVGRTEQLAEFTHAAEGLLKHLLGPEGAPTRRFRNVVKEIAHPGHGHSSKQSMTIASALLRHAVTAVLCADALCDVDPALWYAGAGPWEAARRATGHEPDPMHGRGADPIRGLWHALLADLADDRLQRLGEALGTPQGGTPYGAVCNDANTLTAILGRQCDLESDLAGTLTLERIEARPMTVRQRDGFSVLCVLQILACADRLTTEQRQTAVTALSPHIADFAETFDLAAAALMHASLASG